MNQHASDIVVDASPSMVYCYGQLSRRRFWTTAARAWLTADGLQQECPTEIGKSLARQLDPDAVAWFLYFSDLNAFAYLAGARAAFTWA